MGKDDDESTMRTMRTMWLTASLSCLIYLVDDAVG